MEGYIVTIQRNHDQGLGSDGKILTCAHLCRRLPPDQSFCCEFQINKGGKQSTAVTVTVDYSFDFMVLGSETLAGTSCSDPESWNQLDVLDSPVPVRLEYSGRVFSAVLEGFLFAPDGKTKVNTDISVKRDSPFISLSVRAESGSSGSPIFTSENHLIGVLTNAWGSEETGCGILMDDAMSCWIRKMYVDFPILAIDHNSKCVRSVTEF